MSRRKVRPLVRAKCRRVRQVRTILQEPLIHFLLLKLCHLLYHTAGAYAAAARFHIIL